MKKMLIIALTFFAVTIISCTKDNTDYTLPENLIGTTWEYKYYQNVKTDYISLKFTSATVVELRTKEFSVDDRLDHTCSYTIEGNTITIVYEETSTTSGIPEEVTITGIIKKATINLTTKNGTYLFRKH